MSLRENVAALCKRHAQPSHKKEPEAPSTWRGHLARRLLLLSAALTLPTHAQIDTNSNGMSDVWERHFNNDELFDPQNPDHAPGADPDGDGWSNLKESIAGTDPFHGNPPEGMVATQITYLKDQEEAPTREFPEGRLIDLTVISWETLPGKQYTLLFSPDLTASSWLAASAPIIGDGQPAAVAVTLTDAEDEEPDKLFWRVAIDDLDSDGDGLTDHEEFALGFNPYSAQTHPGISDFWVAENFPNSTASFDPDAVPYDNGLTNQEMHDLGIDPNQNIVLGPVNLGTQEEITDYPDLSFREENPADLYHQDSVEGWEAVIGEYIEVWDRDDGNPYMELQSHLGAHGVKQNFEMLPGSQVSFILRYKGRYEWYAPYDNAFTLDVEGAEQVTVNGSVVAPSGGVSSATFMDDDDDAKYEEWHYASIVITASPSASSLVPVALSFIPVNTDPVDGQEITRGGFVGIFPVEITAVFGVGPHKPGVPTSRERLEEFLNTVKVVQVGDIWLVNGQNADEEDKIYCIQVAADQETLLAALATDGMNVIFDGHANFGIGPNFLISSFKNLSDFTNFGVKYTAIPQYFRGDGTEPDPMPFYLPDWLQINIGDEDLDILLTIGRHKLSSEGWAYLVLDEVEIKGDVLNYNTPFIGGLRFKNTDGIGHGQIFTKKGNEFNNEWHFNLGNENEYLMIAAPDDKIPKFLRYKNFFYNACSTGPHFIENFQHGVFIYTSQSCEVDLATRNFVAEFISGKSISVIVTNLNNSGVGGAHLIGDNYHFHDFNE